MKIYNKLILDKLIDKYEKSKIYKGCSNKTIFIKMGKEFPEYFNEYEIKYKDEIDNTLKIFEEKGYVILQRGRGYESHIVIKVTLNVLKVDCIYSFLGREKKLLKEEKLLEIIKEYKDKEQIIFNFYNYIIDCVKENKSFKKYLDIDNPLECENILKGIYYVLNEKEEVFRRTFSVKIFSNSKVYEKLENKILKIIEDFKREDFEFENNIVRNYTYVYFKGNIQFEVNNKKINTRDLVGGIGISSKDIDKISDIKIEDGKLITVENLTSFHNLKNETALYLGGFHNKVRRDLLRKIYKDNEGIEYYHCGDIDIGGFKILNDLKKKTGIPFKILNMDKETLVKFKNYGRELTLREVKELEIMIKKEDFLEFTDVLEMMLDLNIKLEQEIIF